MSFLHAVTELELEVRGASSSRSDALFLLIRSQLKRFRLQKTYSSVGFLITSQWEDAPRQSQNPPGGFGLGPHSAGGAVGTGRCGCPLGIAQTPISGSKWMNGDFSDCGLRQVGESGHVSSWATFCLFWFKNDLLVSGQESRLVEDCSWNKPLQHEHRHVLHQKHVPAEINACSEFYKLSRCFCIATSI